MTPYTAKASAILSSALSKSGKFLYDGESYSGLRVLSRDKVFGIKDAELSRVTGVVGDAKIRTKIISGPQLIEVIALATAS